MRELLVQPLDETLYTTLKQTLLRRLVQPAHGRTEQHPNTEELGDIQILRHHA